MKIIEHYTQEFFLGACIYCGSKADTREHTPPKVFLDKPYPAELPVVGACKKCNQGFSQDEEYMACFIEFVISGSADPDSVQRSMVKRALKHSEKLRSRLASAKKIVDGRVFFEMEEERVSRVAKKIAVGHIYFELGLIADMRELDVMINPIITMNEKELIEFNSINWNLYPEVHSRALTRMIEGGDESYNHGWLVVQDGRYQYAVIQNSGCTEVRIIFSEYLACQVIWRGV